MLWVRYCAFFMLEVRFNFKWLNKEKTFLGKSSRFPELVFKDHLEKKYWKVWLVDAKKQNKEIRGRSSLLNSVVRVNTHNKTYCYPASYFTSELTILLLFFVCFPPQNTITKTSRIVLWHFTSKCWCFSQPTERSRLVIKEISTV